MRGKWFLGLGCALAATMVVSTSLAGPGWGRGPGGGPGACWMQVPPEGLSQEKSQALEQLRQRHYREMASLRDQAWAKRQELWNIRSQPNPDPQTISRLEREIFDLHGAMREKAFSYRQEVRNIDPNLWCGMGFGPMGMGGGMMGPGGRGRP
jgi:Spy/CpxP family protein refolding chaperone